MKALLALSGLLLAFRLYAAERIGFGDSEALYASYAQHPQPAYLDHPGLVGLAFRAIGDTPARVHLVTAFAATLVPWIVFAAARALGAPTARAAITAAVVAVTPEIAVGLFALTPDLLLAPLWLGAIALASIGLRASDVNRSAAALLAAGLLAGVASAAKVSGLLLLVALAVTYARDRERRRTPWPWAGLALGLIVFLPVVAFEARTGWPMLRHRLVDSAMPNGGPNVLRNLGALVGGQLVYLSPVLAWAAVLVGRDLVRNRDEDATSRLLFDVFAIPLVPLALLSIFSAVSEPHWIAPALLALALHAARTSRALAPRRLLVAGAAGAGAFTLAAHLWVLVPSSASLLPRGVDPKVDIASELYGWPRAIDAIRDLVRTQATPFDPEGREVVVVGPHWTVCAQIQAAMPETHVGCATPIRDDFDDWLPRKVWKSADHVLFVTDNRFATTGADLLPDHVAVESSRVTVIRGGRLARVFQLVLYDRRATGLRDR
jgi:hypothetical protein